MKKRKNYVVTIQGGNSKNRKNEKSEKKLKFDESCVGTHKGLFFKTKETLYVPNIGK